MRRRSFAAVGGVLAAAVAVSLAAARLHAPRVGIGDEKYISLSVLPGTTVCLGTELTLTAKLSDLESGVDVTFKVDGQGWPNSTVTTVGGIATKDFDTGDPPAAADNIPGTITFKATAADYEGSNEVPVTVVQVKIVSISKATIEYCNTTTITAEIQPYGRIIEWDILDVTDGVLISPSAGTNVARGTTLTVKANRFTQSGSFKVRAHDSVLTTCADETTINVKGFKRTDNTTGDPTTVSYIYPYPPGGYSSSATFKLVYTPGSEDQCDGLWKHNYFLKSKGSFNATVEDTSIALLPGGCLYAAAWAVDVDGTISFTCGMAADCRSEGATASVTLTPAGVSVTLNVKMKPGGKTSDGVSLAKNFKITVNKDSPEGKALQHEVPLVISAKSTFADTGFGGWSLSLSGSGEIKWQKSIVLADHFEPYPCE